MRAVPVSFRFSTFNMSATLLFPLDKLLNFLSIVGVRLGRKTTCLATIGRNRPSLHSLQQPFKFREKIVAKPR